MSRTIYGQFSVRECLSGVYTERLIHTGGKVKERAVSKPAERTFVYVWKEGTPCTTYRIVHIIYETCDERVVVVMGDVWGLNSKTAKHSPSIVHCSRRYTGWGLPSRSSLFQRRILLDVALALIRLLLTLLASAHKYVSRSLALSPIVDYNMFTQLLPVTYRGG